MCMHTAYPAVCIRTLYNKRIQNDMSHCSTENQSTMVPPNQILHKTCISSHTFSWVQFSLVDVRVTLGFCLTVCVCFGRTLFKNMGDRVMFEDNIGECCFSFSNPSCSKENMAVSSCVSIFLPTHFRDVRPNAFDLWFSNVQTILQTCPISTTVFIRKCCCRMNLICKKGMHQNKYTASLVCGLLCKRAPLLQGQRMIWKKWLALPWLKLSRWWKLAMFLRLRFGWNLDWDLAWDVSFEHVLESCHDKDMQVLLWHVWVLSQPMSCEIWMNLDLNGFATLSIPANCLVLGQSTQQWGLSPTKDTWLPAWAGNSTQACSTWAKVPATKGMERLSKTCMGHIFCIVDGRLPLLICISWSYYVCMCMLAVRSGYMGWVGALVRRGISVWMSPLAACV